MTTILESFEDVFREKLYPNDRQAPPDALERVWLIAEEKLGLRRERICTILSGFGLLYVIFRSIIPLASHLICTIYPVIQTRRLYKTPNPDHQKLSNVLLYWILFSTLSLLDFSPLAALPFYYFAKTALFVFLHSPSTDGISKASQFIDPILEFIQSWFSQPDAFEKIE